MGLQVSPGTFQAWFCSRPPEIAAPSQGTTTQFLCENVVPPASPRRVSAHAYGSVPPIPFLQPLGVSPVAPGHPPAPAPPSARHRSPRPPPRELQRCKRALPQLLPPPTPPVWQLWAGNSAGSASRFRVPAPGPRRRAKPALQRRAPRVRSPRLPPRAPAGR